MRMPRAATTLALCGGLLALGACKTGERPKDDGKAAPAKARGAKKSDAGAVAKDSGSDKSAPAKTEGAAPGGTSAKGGAAASTSTSGTAPGGANMDALRESKSVREQARRTLVDHYLKTGNEALAASKLAEAEKNFADALDLDPKNEDARRGLTEVGAILGKVGPTAASRFEDAVNEKTVKAQQARMEVQNLAATGDAKVKTGDVDAAVDLFEKALVIVRLYPSSIGFTPDEAGLKSKLSSARKQAEAASEARRRRMVSEANERSQLEAAAQLRARRSRLQKLFHDANLAMERGNYQLAQNLAQEIKRADPDNEAAERLRQLAFSAAAAESEDSLRATLADEWKHVFAQLEEAYTPQTADYTFPDTWETVQGPRAPRGLSPAAAGIDDPRSREARNKLMAVRTAVNFEEEPLEAAVRFLSQISGTNIVVMTAATDGKAEDELMVDLRLDSPVSVSDILNLITSLRGLSWKIDSGVVQITTPEDALGDAVIQLYDVKDLATEIRNFPGSDVNLDPTGEYVVEEEVADPAPEFLLDQIVELITTNVDPSVWEESGSVEGLPPGTLVVKAPPGTHSKVQSLLDGLRGAGGLQVSIETRFVTVQNNFLQEVGVDLRGLGDQSGGLGVPGKGGIPAPGGITVPVTFDDVFFGSAGNPTGVGTGGDTGVFYNLNSDGDIRARFENLFDVALGKSGVLTNLGGLSFQGTLIDDTQLEVILRAVEKSDRSTLVIAPRLTAYNGQRANVTVLNQVSYISDFDVEIAQAAQIGDPIVQTLRDGVILDLRPTVSADRRFITMELRPTIAILTRPIATFQTTLANGPPVTIQLPELRIQRVRTTVTMPDGGTLLLGGLKFFEERRLESTIPWLDKIPIVNFFVSRKGTFLERRNLLVLIRARILRPEENEPGTPVSR